MLMDHHRRMLEIESGISPELIAARGYRSVERGDDLYQLGFSPKQTRYTPGLLIPIFTPDGGNGLYRFRPDKPPSRLKHGHLEPVKYLQPKGAALRLDCHPLARAALDNPAKRLAFVEGEKKADALTSRGLATIALPGVYGFTGRNDWRGVTLSVDFKYIALNGRQAYIIFDSDAALNPNVSRAEAQLAEVLRRKGADVLIVRIPAAADGRKQGADDFLVAGHTLEELLALVVSQAAPLHTSVLQAQADGLPPIEISGRHLRDITADALAALERENARPYLFVRSGALARVRADEHARPLIEAVDESILRGRLARVANFVTTRERDGQKVVTPQDPPLVVVRDLQAAGGWPFPAITGIVECPSLRPDGTIITSPGYDSATGLFYYPAEGLRIPEIAAHPEPAERNAALALLWDALGEFPYADDASRANALAAALTPILRPAILGCVPLALIDAPQAGTGKSMLAGVIRTIAAGQEASVITAPSDDDEWGKRITAALMTGPSIITIDNLTGVLYTSKLAAALTLDVWRDRILGRTEMVNLPQRATWIATGNNIRLGGDIPRRAYWIRLDAKTSRPWKRDGFRHENLLAWVHQRRGALVAAALTLARAWWSDGCPAPAASPNKVGGFEEWVRVLAGVLAHAGVKAFLANLDEMYEQADDDGPQWEAFLLALHERFGHEPQTVANICERIASDSDLADAVPDMLDAPLDQNGHVKPNFKKRLGRAMAARLGKRHGDIQIRVERAADDSHVKVSRWRIVAGFAGSAGTILPDLRLELDNSNVVNIENETDTGRNIPRAPREPRKDIDDIDLRGGSL